MTLADTWDPGAGDGRRVVALAARCTTVSVGDGGHLAGDPTEVALVEAALADDAGADPGPPRRGRGGACSASTRRCGS